MKLLKRIHYNAPVTLTFALICLVVLGLNKLTGGWTNLHLFMTYRSRLTDPLMYIRLFGHAIGHASWEHLVGNMLYILMLGPILEEKYGSKLILEMMAITAVLTGIIFNLLFDGRLLGASGIVFMFIILASVTNAEKGRIPITFILICILYLGNEFINAFHKDNISQLAHIIGGSLGGFFGLFLVATGGIREKKNS
ncbi:MAG: rhomboid family intramembrane serine protease [Lachnospiraceae bacterium]|nr:rhomboid family intramembrane serine protease [Lachnospiraceae bacterium]